MEPNEPEVIDSQDDTETTDNEGIEEVIETVEEAEPETDNEPAEESIEDLKKKLATTEAQKEHWREKAQKKVTVKPEAQAKSDNLSSKDLIALMNNKVHEDDVQEVVDFAKFKGLSVAEAIKHSTMRTVLAENSEKRNTAEATHTGRSRSGNMRASEDTLFSKARKTGEIPDSRDDLDRMLEHRYKSN
jgi:hypothetical protein